MSSPEDNGQAQSYSDLLLGDSLQAILDATEADIPRISESRFVNEVLPLLERPFYHQSMAAYTRYVKELTNPLRVTEDNDPNKILFEVPPFIQTTGVTMPAPGMPTTDTTLRNLYVEAERGVDVNPVVAQFMSRITRKPELQKTLLDPLKAILERYGRTIDISDEKNKLEVIAPELAPQVKAAEIPASGDSSFTGEYE
jgi:hypothetical protein